MHISGTLFVNINSIDRPGAGQKGNLYAPTPEAAGTEAAAAEGIARAAVAEPL